MRTGKNASVQNVGKFKMKKCRNERANREGEMMKPGDWRALERDATMKVLLWNECDHSSGGNGCRHILPEGFCQLKTVDRCDTVCDPVRIPGLVAKPTRPESALSLSEDLKLILRKRYNSDAVDVGLNAYDIRYLEGARDAGCEDADKLIKYIDKYGDVKVVEEF